MSRIGCVPGVESQFPQADFPDEAALFIHHENPGQRLGVLAVAAQHGDRLFHRHVRGDPADLGGHPAAGGVLLVFEQAAGELLIARPQQAEKPDLRFLADDLEDVHAVIVREISQQHAELGGLEVAQRVLDERIRQFRDDIGGELRADGLEQEIAFFVVEVFVEVGEVRVVDILGGGQQGGAIGRIQRPQQLVHGIFFEFVRHGRRVACRLDAGKENEAPVLTERATPAVGDVG